MSTIADVAVVTVAVPGAVGQDAKTLLAGTQFAGVPVAFDAAAVVAALRDGAAAALVDLRRGDEAIDLARGVRLELPDARLVGVLDRDARLAAAALSAGVSAVVGPDAGPRQTAAALDEALAGRAFASPDMTGRVLRAVAGELRRRDQALAPKARLAEQARRNLEAPGALRTVFQPIADLRSDGVFGYLALTRFRAVRDEDTSQRFAQARALGLGADLELAAARTALANLPLVSPDALLFVKVSCSTLLDERVEELVTGIECSRAVLELSGHPAPDQASRFARAVALLRDRGLRFSVDETGASFGALDRVLDLAPAFVRLAGGLTRNIDTDRTRRSLALAVTSFASHLGARVIADAIETEEELAALRRLGVDYGLGFAIGRPGPLPARPADERDGGDPAPPGAVAGPVRWAARPGAPTLTIRRSYDFDEASRRVLEAVAERVPGTVPYVALVDRAAGRLRIVDVGAQSCPGLHRGAAFPLAESFDLGAATGDAPQVATGVEPPAQGMATLLGIGAYAVVPFVGEPEAPLATVSLAGLGRTPIHPESLELLLEAGAMLAETLRAEHGDSGDRQEQALRNLSWRDRLSGLSNASRFKEELEGANARASLGSGSSFVAVVKVANFRALTQRLGQAVAEMVLKDTARGLAAQADSVDILARVGPATFGGILHGRRATEADHFCHAVEDFVMAMGRRRGATVDVLSAHQRLGAGGGADALWEAVVERAFVGHADV